ncbi:MAG TPA: methyltransferase domain-containing protein [Patescibacteria group bacterium]|nr:methyltransferase domain-containing protein [Patescibacteria group bacterium]
MSQTTYDAHFWAAAWQQSRQQSSLGTGYANLQGWEDFWNAIAGHMAQRNHQSQRLYQRIIAILAQEGTIRRDDTILDIGCGPGTYTLPLAAFATKVTALDTATVMLDILQEEARRENLDDRVEILTADWQDIPETAAYDVAFAAKTPAIFDYGSLMKMNRVARRSCCLIGFSGPYRIRMRSLLWEYLFGAPLRSNAFDVTFPLNILCRSGFHPTLRYYRYREVYQETQEYMTRHYTQYFKIFGLSGKATEKKIADFLLSHMTDGHCPETIDAVLGVLTWQVDGNPQVL